MILWVKERFETLTIRKKNGWFHPHKDKDVIFNPWDNNWIGIHYRTYWFSGILKTCSRIRGEPTYMKSLKVREGAGNLRDIESGSGQGNPACT